MTQDNAQNTVQRVERLISEVLEIIPNYTSGRGSFSTMPPGYKVRYPDDWQQEFLEVLDPQFLSALKPDTNDIVGLVELVNFWSLVNPISQQYLRHDGTPVLMPLDTITSIVSYIVFENLVRRLVPVLDQEGRLTQAVTDFGGAGARISRLNKLLPLFEVRTHFRDLANHFRFLKGTMQSSQGDLYERLDTGRNLLLHGNIPHSFEGGLVVLLVDLVNLHVMRQELRGAAIVPP